MLETKAQVDVLMKLLESCQINTHGETSHLKRLKHQQICASGFENAKQVLSGQMEIPCGILKLLGA